MLERIFKLTENQTTVRREMLARLTSFMTMAFIIVVNPRILAEAGMPIAGVLFATGASSAVARVRWDDFSEAFPAFLTMLPTPVTLSVATGLSLGLISYTRGKLGSKKHREISPLIWILTFLFLLRYAYLAVE